MQLQNMAHVLRLGRMRKFRTFPFNSKLVTVHGWRPLNLIPEKSEKGTVRSSKWRHLLLLPYKGSRKAPMNKNATWSTYSSLGEHEGDPRNPLSSYRDQIYELEPLLAVHSKAPVKTVPPLKSVVYLAFVSTYGQIWVGLLTGIRMHSPDMLSSSRR